MYPVTGFMSGARILSPEITEVRETQETQGIRHSSRELAAGRKKQQQFGAWSPAPILQGSHRPPGFSQNPWALATWLRLPVPPSNLTKRLPIRAITAAPSRCLLRCLPPAVPAGDNISLLFLVTTGTTNNPAADEGPSKPSRAEEPRLGLRGGNRHTSPRGARSCPLTLAGLSGRFVHDQCHSGQGGRGLQVGAASAVPPMARAPPCLPCKGSWHSITVQCAGPAKGLPFPTAP